MSPTRVIRKVGAFCAAVPLVLAASPAGVSQAELSNSVSSLVALVAEVWNGGGKVCPLAPADAADLVTHVKDARLGEDEILVRLHDLADGLSHEAGYDDFDEVWARAAVVEEPNVDRDRLWKFASCFYPGVLTAPPVYELVSALGATIGSSARAADAALSLLIDHRVIDSVALLTTSDHPASVPVASPVDDPELTGATPVAATLDDALLAKDPARCAYGGSNNGDKYAAGSQLITTWNNLGRRSFSVYNEIGFTWNLARRCTKFGSASRSYAIHSCLQPIACWEFDGYSYDEEGHYYFEGYVQGGWKSRMKANFSLVVLTWPFGSLKTQRRSIYNNMYGHFDGGISRFHGGYDPYYTSCEPSC